MSRFALIFATLWSCLAAAPASGADPVGHWTLDEASGAAANDSSAAANHGVLQQTQGAWGTGVHAGAGLFPGKDHVILVPDSPSLSPTSEITIAAWLRPNRQDTQYVVKKADHNDIDGYELSLSSSTGTAFVRFNQATAANTYKIPSTSLYPSDGSTWLHLAASFDGQDIRLYVNGVLENSASAPDLVLFDNDVPLAIGSEHTGKRPFDGAIDDVQIFDTALSASDIASVMNGLPSGPDTDGDGVSDASDAFSADPTEWSDADGDGVGDNADLDDDNDAMPDTWETSYSFDPNDPSDAALDSDGDGATNGAEYLAGTDPRDNPSSLEVGSWSLDGGAGNLAFDGSGLGNDGVFLGAPFWVTGIHGTALNFDGDTDRVLIADDDTLDLDVAITIAAWIRSSRDGTQYIVKKGRHNKVGGYELALSSSANTAFVRFNQVSAKNTYKILATTPYPQDGVTWMHLAATFDGADIRIYVNGVLENTQPAPGLVIATNALDLVIGGQDNDKGPFKGSIDDVRLYDFALTDEEVGLVMAGLPLIVDADGDGFADELDAFPADPTEWGDTDGDGNGDNADPDDDDDGMPDAWETPYGFDPLDPADASQDADSDGVSNLDEYTAGTHPWDSDRDGMPNRWENAYAFDPMDPADAALDADADGISNLDEYTADSHPRDSDGDGVGDAQDLFPLDPGEWADADGDGSGDNADLDDDSDGMPDLWEILYGLHPRDASDAAGDNDADRVSNLDEYLQGSDPREHNGYTEVGIWSFDEAGGGVVSDASGLANDGTLGGTASFVPGRFGNAIDLGSSGDYVSVPHHESLDVSDEMTIAAWIRATESATQFIVRKADYRNVDGFELSLSGSANTAFVRFNQDTAGNTHKVYAVTPYPVDGSWMHVAASFDRADIRVYVNGVLETVAPAPGLVIHTNTLPLLIGAELDGSRAFSGAIDDVRLYDRALTDAEMLLIH
ncbi:MAG: LamG domain-containing protein, partial [Myxococcales bacterium]|nr:LamG domain-containing protein [Myxococcales bacterium]